MANRAGVGQVDAAMLTSQSTGVAILSTGADKECYSFATVMKLFDQSTLRAVSGVAVAPVDGYTNKSDFTDHRGNVSAFALLPGKYYFSPVTQNPYVVGVKVPAFAFEMRAGETVYLGEIYMPTACAFDNAFKVNDRYERDIAIAVGQNPALTGRPPTKRLLLNHVAGDGSHMDSAAPIALIPVQERFFPPPRRPENGGAATLNDVLPKGASAAVMPGAVPVAGNDGLTTRRWDGLMSCGARQDIQGTKPYQAVFAMEKRGNDVKIFRKTVVAEEMLSGRVAGHTLALTGTGASPDATRHWTFRFTGAYSDLAPAWFATGQMLASGVVLRQCELSMLPRP